MLLHKSIDLRRNVKYECAHFIKHFKDVCVCASFLVQIIEVFPSTAYKNNTVCQVNLQTRLDRENYWTETLRTSYLYGLNERKRIADPNFPVQCSFSPIPRTRQRSARCRNNVNYDNLKNMGSIFKCIYNYIADGIENAFYNMQILLNNTGKIYL